MNITLKQLQVFINTAKNGSISIAAKKCFITQAAASISLTQLEQAIGTNLFDRLGKRLHINNNGRELLPKAIAVIEQANEIEHSLNLNPTTGNINLGASTTIANYVLPQYLAQFKKDHPGIKVQLEIANTDQIIDKTLALELDFALIEGDCLNPSIIKTDWLDDSLSIICSKDHAILSKNKINSKDLIDYPWAVREAGSGTREIFNKSFKFINNLEIAISLASSEAIINYVANSDCLGYVSKNIVNNLQNNSIKILEVSDLKLKRKFYEIHHKNKYQSNCVKLLLSYLKNT